MNKKYGNLYIEDVIPKSTYSGMDADNKNATVWNTLVTNASLSDKAAYDIVKTIFDKKAELVTVHKEAENFDLKYQSNDAAVIPFHPGAIRYFAEKGIKLK
jgi:TRAP transporter TAXI family solute receptor